MYNYYKSVCDHDEYDVMINLFELHAHSKMVKCGFNIVLIFV